MLEDNELGKRFTNTELCNAARGILTGEFKYDLSCGDKIIAVLHDYVLKVGHAIWYLFHCFHNYKVCCFLFSDPSSSNNQKSKIVLLR